MKKNSVLENECPAHHTMAMLGSTWKPLLIWTLRYRTARFGQIAASIGSISRKVLTAMLKELEADGMITRVVHDEVQLRVEYSLTEKSRALIPIMLQIVDWDKKYMLQNDT